MGVSQETVQSRRLEFLTRRAGRHHRSPFLRCIPQRSGVYKSSPTPRLAMPADRLLEITVESLDTALAAERGGADRIEVCAELAHGGVTPPVATLRKVHDELEIPVFAIIRPRAGNFVYTDAEFVTMLR